MQEMKLIDAVAAETAIKDFFKKQIDEEYLYLEVTDCNADISAILNALPEIPAVPLEVHERIKRELNEEKQALIAGQETLQKALAERNAEIERLKEYEDIRPTGCPNCHRGNFSNSKFCSHCGTQLQGKKKDVRTEAIKEFADKLCEGRVSNDPVVIAVKVELKEMAGEG